MRIKRRAEVVGIFPSEAAIHRLDGARCWSRATIRAASAAAKTLESALPGR